MKKPNNRKKDINNLDDDQNMTNEVKNILDQMNESLMTDRENNE